MKFSKNIFRIFFFLTGVITLYIGINFFITLHRYFQLSLDVKAYFDSWSVEEISSSKYIIIARYHYSIGGATYHNHYRLSESVYPNYSLAQEHVEHWRKSQNWVWINPKNPHQSSLFRPLPLKKGVYLILCIGIFLYFFWLRFYVHRLYFKN